MEKRYETRSGDCTLVDNPDLQHLVQCLHSCKRNWTDDQHKQERSIIPSKLWSQQSESSH